MRGLSKLNTVSKDLLSFRKRGICLGYVSRCRNGNGDGNIGLVFWCGDEGDGCTYYDNDFEDDDDNNSHNN